MELVSSCDLQFYIHSFFVLYKHKYKNEKKLGKKEY